MAEETNIEWADATLNFWVGCTKVSVGEKGACTNCYAETWAKRWPQYRETWGPGALRVRFMHLLAKAMKLERLAIAKLARGEGAFFCFSNSLSDIFDKEVPIEWLREAFEIMKATPHVTYLLLTKRPQNIVRRSHAAGGLPPNAAPGCTAVTQHEANRDIPFLMAAKRMLKAIFVFVSIEPMRENIVLGWALTGQGDPADPTYLPPVDWVICGFESGPHAKPPIVAAARSLRDQCAAAAVAFLFKQWGAWHADALAYTDMHGRNPPPNMKIGVVKSGRLLDGVEHNARPMVAA